MKKLASFLIAIGLLATPMPAQSVVFGEDVIDASTRYPWVVSIWWDRGEYSWDEPVQICTGSLIQPDIVLTAAHCIFKSGLYYVQAGSDILGDSAPLLEVSAVWSHPRYSSKKFVNDIGLLKLSQPSTVTPMAVAKSKDQKKVDSAKSYRILGWGLNQNEEEATYLRTAMLSNQNRAATSAYKKAFNSKTMIAAGKYIKSEKVYAGGCNGDSGGPIISKINNKDMIVGVTAYGAVGCNWDLPTVFTKVSYYEKDLQAGLRTILKNESSFNRAAPKVEVSPTITGNLVRGGTATCNPGVWSANTTSVTVKWTSPWGATKVGTDSIQLDGGYRTLDTDYVCQVTGSNGSVSVTVEVKYTLPAEPWLLTYPRISGPASYASPLLGSVATCSGQSWRGSGVSETVNWYASTSYDGKTTYLGSGTSLTLSAEVEALAPATRFYLTCEVIGTNAGGSDTYETSIYIYAPFRK